MQLLFTIPRLLSTAVEGLAKGQPFNGSLQIYVSAGPGAVTTLFLTKQSQALR